MSSVRNQMRSLLFDQSNNTMFATYVTDRILRIVDRTSCQLTITDTHILLSTVREHVRFHAQPYTSEWGVNIPRLLVEQQTENSEWELQLESGLKRHVDACLTRVQDVMSEH